MQNPKPTAERILDFAEDAFAERGYDATSLGEVANSVGISGPGIYKHFKSKGSLYEAVLGRLLDPFLQIISDEIIDPMAKPEVLQVARRMLFHHVQHPNLARLVQHAALAGGSQLELLVERWYRPIFQRAQVTLFDRQTEGALCRRSRSAPPSWRSQHDPRLHHAGADCTARSSAGDPLADEEVSRFYDVICLLSEELQR